MAKRKRKKSRKKRKHARGYKTHACAFTADPRGFGEKKKCGSGRGAFKIFTFATKEMHKGKTVRLEVTRTRR